MREIPQVVQEDGVITIAPPAMEGRPPGMGVPLRIEPRKTAVIVVDVQRYFLETPPFTAMQGIVGPIAGFLPVARASGMTVAHVITEFRPGMEDAGRPGTRTRQMMDSVAGHADGSGGGTLVKGSWTAEIPRQLSPEPADLVVRKTRFSGFFGSTLDAALRERGIESLIFAGGTTTVCVESSVRDSVFLEYNPLVLADCTGDMSPELHASALMRIDMFFGWVCDSRALGAVLSELARPSGQASAAAY